MIPRREICLGNKGTAMRTSCPQCDAAFELNKSAKGQACPSCGVPLTDGERLAETVSIKHAPREKVAHFELLRNVGSGTFGDVYKARDTQLDRIVALKVLRRGVVNEHAREMFLREGRAAAQLRHPQIVSVHGIGTDGDTCYIVSDFIEGVTLAKYMKSRQFEPREAAELCASIADAMHHAHTAGVVHRDLKPSNIMLDGRRQPHVTDFGLAKREAGDETFTVEGDLLGTVPYMPPEQAGGRSHQADRRSDIYSLGVVLYELLTGSYPFHGATESIIYQILHDEPRPPRQANPAVPRDLQTICLKALSKEPSHRYATAADMADDLRRFLSGEPIKARPVGRLERGWRWCRRNPTKAISTAVIVSLLAASAAIYADNHRLYRERTLISTNNQRPHEEPDPIYFDVHVVTDPPGARAVCVPLDPLSGAPKPEQKVKLSGVTPSQVRLAPGDYLVVVEVPDHGFHEVHRRVPSGLQEGRSEYLHESWQEFDDGSLMWPAITIPRLDGAAPRMARFEAGSFRLPAVPVRYGLTERAVTVDSFWLDVKEVTIGDCREAHEKLPSSIRLAARNESDALKSSGDDLDAMHSISYNGALFFAEILGKRLPSDDEYVFAATMGGTRKFPWGDDGEQIDEWLFGNVGGSQLDILPSDPPVFGLYSNVAEWCDSRLSPPPGMARMSPDFREKLRISHVVCGGTEDVIRGEPSRARYSQPEVSGPRHRISMHDFERFVGLGFRCARSARARFMD